jgi:hypothetical protein
MKGRNLLAKEKKLNESPPLYSPGAVIESSGECNPSAILNFFKKYPYREGSWKLSRAMEF